MKKILISLLPKRLQEREALNLAASNIKPRLGGFRRLTLVLSIFLFLMGYQPNLGFPPIKQTLSHAQEQTEVISTDSIPQIQLPHPGYLSTRFSSWHPGVDIATGLGMPIHPITEGEVLEVNFWFWGYGRHVVISHQDGYKSLYGHMDQIYVKVGQQVTQTDTIGRVGLTGRTSGAHTHLEIQKDGKYIDPLTILPPLQDYPKEEYLKPVGGQEKNSLHKNLKPDFS